MQISLGRFLLLHEIWVRFLFQSGCYGSVPRVLVCFCVCVCAVSTVQHLPRALSNLMYLSVCPSLFFAPVLVLSLRYYVAFLKRDLEGCQNSHCSEDLAYRLISLLLTRIAYKFFEKAVLPRFTVILRKVREARQLDAV